MARQPHKGSIVIAADEEFQRKAWRVQRAGWVVMLAVAIAALFGAFGDGPASSMKIGDESSGLAIQYERFVRANAPQDMAFEISAAAQSSDTTAQIWLDRSWVESNRINSITPAPASSTLLADRIVYTFATRKSAAPLKVRIDLESRHFGVLHARAGVRPGEALVFRQLAYP